MRKTLFSLLRIGLNLETPTTASLDVAGWGMREWYGIVGMALRQGVAGVVFDGFSSCVEAGVVKAIAGEEEAWQQFVLQWQAEVVTLEMRYQSYEDDMVSMAKFFNGHEMPFMVIKGYGVGLNYPVPNHRPMGDLDVWFPTGFREADDLIHRELGIEIDNAHHHHTVYGYKGLGVENHYDFVPLYGHRSNRRVEAYLQRVAMQGSEEMVVQGERMLLPSPAFNAVFLMRHAALHFAAAEIELRHVLDWAMFVNKYHEKIDWDEVDKVVKDSGMEVFMNAMCGLCVNGLKMDRGWFPKYREDKEGEERVLREILIPAFSEKAPKGLFAYWGWMLRRWWQGRWKHDMVYAEGSLETFCTQVYAHFVKPKTLVNTRG